MANRLPNSQRERERLLKALERLEKQLDPKGEFDRVLSSEIQLVNKAYQAGVIDLADKEDLVYAIHNKHKTNKEKFIERLNKENNKALINGLQVKGKQNSAEDIGRIIGSIVGLIMLILILF